MKDLGLNLNRTQSTLFQVIKAELLSSRMALKLLLGATLKAIFVDMQNHFDFLLVV